jgi:mono/diheme cytochrome c family protein
LRYGAFQAVKQGANETASGNLELPAFFASSRLRCSILLSFLLGLILLNSAVASLAETSAVTFNKDIAPLIFQHCSSCHRPGQSGPFPLLSYNDVKKRAKQIAEVTARRYMPPWLPEPGYGEFEGERRLRSEQIAVLRQWVAGGLKEGNPSDLPPAPVWTNAWELGQPDLVLTLPKPVEIPAEGRDVYRILVIPQAANENHYVRALDFHAGNRAVHHAFFLIDRTRGSRLQAAKNLETGEGGMDLPESANTPEGQSLSWQPGRKAYVCGEGMSWLLPKGADLVLQLHLKPTGKPELLQPQLGLYFTDQPPTKSLFNFPLTSKEIDIPAGAHDYTITDSYRLPVDVEVLRVNPHAHYLATDMQGYAVLPDGTRKELLWIKHWDFAWQGDYRLKQPLFLPKGTTLHMKYTYDNSESNPANPHHPPEHVRYGLETTDEMGELWVQFTGNPADLDVIRKGFALRDLEGNLTTYQYRLRRNPKDAAALTAMGKTKLLLGERDQAVTYLKAAIEADALLDEPHYYLGVMLRLQNQPALAREEFQRALDLNPDSYKAAGNLGALAAQQGKFEKAERYLRRSLAINPEDPTSRELLDQILSAKQKPTSGTGSPPN